VQTITDAVNAGNSQSFSYDNLQRLSQATGGYGTSGFTYDADGNQLSQTLGAATTNYGYGTGSDLLSTLSVGGVATQAIGYTADGRMASFNPGIQAPGGQFVTSLSYNQGAQLTAVNSGSGSLASYAYDVFGERYLKTLPGGYGEFYAYGQDSMLLEDFNLSEGPQVDYIYLNGRPIAVLNNVNGPVYFLHDDSLGTPQLATDSNQNIAWQTSYQPFGQASVSGTITQNLRFPGQYFDVESGWNHNGFRDYIPSLGRYVEPDPLGRAGSGNNLYAYVNNDPENLADPLGLCAANPCPPVPPHPPNANVNANMAAVSPGPNPFGLPGNIDSISSATYSAINWSARFQSWAQNVCCWNSAWGYQSQGAQYDDFGNFNYGATGTALGLSSSELLIAAGIVKNFNYWSKGESNPYSNQPLTNDPHKMDMIVQGIKFAKNGCTQ